MTESNKGMIPNPDTEREIEIALTMVAVQYHHSEAVKHLAMGETYKADHHLCEIFSKVGDCVQGTDDWRVEADEDTEAKA